MLILTLGITGGGVVAADELQDKSHAFAAESGNSEFGVGAAASDAIRDDRHTIRSLTTSQDVNDTERGDDNVETEQADIQLNSISAPDEIGLNDTLEVQYELENVGTAEGTETFVDLDINGTLYTWDADVTVPAGETVTGTLEFDNVDSYEIGDTIDYSVELADFGDTASGTTDVVGTPDIQLNSISAPDEIGLNDTLEVQYELENVGTADATESFVNLWENETVRDTDADVTVPAGETVNGTLVFDDVADAYEAGDTIEFSVELADFGNNASGTADVVAGNPLLPYADDQGVVTISGLQNAIEDWRTGEIGVGLLGDVIDYWRSGEPVS